MKAPPCSPLPSVRSDWRSMRNLELVCGSRLGIGPQGTLVLSLLTVVIAFFLAGAWCTISADQPIPGNAAEEWLDQMGRYFDEHPELKNERGSGWKPYNRAKWARERRATEGVASLGEARWHVWEEKVRRSGGTSKASVANWFSMGPSNMSGRILCIDFDPTDANIVYAGSASGGLWKSNDNGLSWATTTDELPTLAIGAVCVLPSNPDIVLIGTGEGTGAGAGDDGVGILKSTDAGQTWNTTSLTFPITAGHGFHVMKVIPNTETILAGTNAGLYRSTDNGDNWTQIKASGHWYDIAWKPDDPTKIYACRGLGPSFNNVKISTDDGLTWSLLGTGQPASSLIGKTKIAVSAADPNVIYANYTNSSNHQTLGVYKSIDAGATWNLMTSTPNMTNSQGWYNLTLAVDPDDADVVIAGGVSLYRATDGGVSFSKTGEGFILGNETDVHWDHHAIVYEPGSSNTVWVGNDGGVWRSTDDGATWSSRREGIVSYQFYDICASESNDFAMGGAQDNGIPGRLGFDDWFVSNLLADGFVCNIAPGNPDRIYAEWQFGNHVRSIDGGQSWVATMSGITGNGAWMTPVAMDLNKPKQLFTSTSDGVFRTDNRMNTWSQVGNQTAIWIDHSLADSLTVWTVNSIGPHVSTDDGNTWTAAAGYGFSVGSETKVATHPTEPNTAFITFGGYSTAAHIVMTTDLGLTWTNVTGDFPAQPVNTMVVDPDDPDAWYIGTDVGVWTSSDGGATWMPFDTGLPNAVISDLEIRRSARKLVAGTFGRGAWETDLPGLPTGIAAGGSVGSSHDLLLDPPSPNPVRGETLLRFAARHDGPVSLDVYDIRGRRVDHVADLSRGDGIIRTATWSTEGLPSGVYFARLIAGSRTTVRRVVVTK